MNSHVASKSLLKDVQISDSEKNVDTGPVTEQVDMALQYCLLYIDIYIYT